MNDISSQLSPPVNPRASGSWMSSPLARVLFLAAVTAGVFFIAEHKVDISNTQNFVENIEEQESWAAGGNKLRRFTFLGCAAIGMLSLLLGKVGRFRLNLPTVLMACYIIWAGVSVTWSIDSGATMRRYIVMICCVVGCFGFARFVRVKDVVLVAVLVPVSFLMLGIVAEIIFGSFRPHVGEYRFAGTIHPNNQAANLAIGSIAAYVMAQLQPKAKQLYYGIFGLLFLFLILTKCRSATATVPVALGVIWLTSQSRQNIFLGLGGGFCLAAFAGLICIVSGFDPISEYQEVLLLGRGEETGSSLTGRLPLWEDLSLYITFRPWQGYGYGAFWTPRHIYDIAVSQEWVISEAHSSYVEAALQLGAVGGLLMALTEFATFFYAGITYRRTQRPEYLFLVGGVIFCIVRGFTESGLGDPASVSSCLFLALAAHSWHPPKKLIDTTGGANDDSDATHQPANRNPYASSSVTYV